MEKWTEFSLQEYVLFCWGKWLWRAMRDQETRRTRLGIKEEFAFDFVFWMTEDMGTFLRTTGVEEAEKKREGENKYIPEIWLYQLETAFSCMYQTWDNRVSTRWRLIFHSRNTKYRDRQSRSSTLSSTLQAFYLFIVSLLAYSQGHNMIAEWPVRGKNKWGKEEHSWKAK